MREYSYRFSTQLARTGNMACETAFICRKTLSVQITRFDLLPATLSRETTGNTHFHSVPAIQETALHSLDLIYFRNVLHLSMTLSSHSNRKELLIQFPLPTI